MAIGRSLIDMARNLLAKARNLNAKARNAVTCIKNKNRFARQIYLGGIVFYIVVILARNAVLWVLFSIFKFQAFYLFEFWAGGTKN